MGFNSAFKWVKIVKNPGNGRLNNLNNLNYPVLNVLTCWQHKNTKRQRNLSLLVATALQPNVEVQGMNNLITSLHDNRG